MTKKMRIDRHQDERTESALDLHFLPQSCLSFSRTFVILASILFLDRLAELEVRLAGFLFMTDLFTRLPEAQINVISSQESLT